MRGEERRHRPGTRRGPSHVLRPVPCRPEETPVPQSLMYVAYDGHDHPFLAHDMSPDSPVHAHSAEYTLAASAFPGVEEESQGEG